MTSDWAYRACFVVFLFSAVFARAQVGIYGNFNVTHAGSISYTGTESTADTLYGGGGGIYDDFLHAGPIGVGVDLRGDYASGGLYHYRSLLAGIRVAAKPPILALRPYLQFSAGVGGTRYTGSHSIFISRIPWGDKFVYEILGGVDWGILPHVDFRAVEVGVGRQKSMDDGAGPDTLTVVNSGVVLRF